MRMDCRRFNTLPEMFLERIRTTPDRIAYRYPDRNEAWLTLTWKEAGERVRDLALGLMALGLKSEDRVAIASSTRIEWILADLAILCARGATTTIYPSNTPDECAYILSDSGARFLFAEDGIQIAKMANAKGLERIISLTGNVANAGSVPIMTLDELAAMGRAYGEQHPKAFEEAIRSVEPNRLATLIYTSGTTGQPKGVELIHDCWAYEGWAIAELGILSIDDLQFLWLPLSHAFGKVLEAAQIQIGFETAVDGRVPKLVDNLAVVRPTFMAAAPRIFEKVHNKVVQGVEEAGGLKRVIFDWAMEVGRKASARERAGRAVPPHLAVQRALADKLVFSKLRERFGGRLRFFVSGSAALSFEMAEFFHAAGILILEGYGLTESSAASFVNRLNSFRFGTVGKPLTGTEVKIAPEDGEILIRGPGVMRGYHNLPEETQAALTPYGWLRTGDIGQLDDAGFLTITDRKKDLIKTSGGKYVAPQKIEGKLKALCPYLSQVVLVGEGRNFCSVLVTLDEEGIRNWARDHGLAGKTLAELAEAEEVKAIVKDAIDRLNSSLASHETVKRFAILPRDLTVEDGELTPSLKVKRPVVLKKYADVIDKLYAGQVLRR